MKSLAIGIVTVSAAAFMLYNLNLIKELGWLAIFAPAMFRA